MSDAAASDGTLQLQFHAAVAVVVVTSLTTVLIELINWLLVYRTSAYKRVVEDMERTNKKLEALRLGTAGKDKKDKKLKAMETSVLDLSRSLWGMRTKTYVVAGVIMLVAYQLVTRKFGGLVVAKLPFSPPGLLQRLTLQKITSKDTTDCAAPFIYVLCQLCVRANIAKAMGMGPSRAVQRTTGFDQWTAAAGKEA